MRIRERLPERSLTRWAWRSAVRHAGLLSQLDLLRATGVRYAWRRRRHAWRWEHLQPKPSQAVYRAIWLEASQAVGAELGEVEDGMLELRRAGASTRISPQHVLLDDAATLEVALDKTRVHRLLEEVGVAVPPHLEFAPEGVALAAEFLAAGGPCVVKPATGTGAGWGVTVAVGSRTQLRRATLNAARYAPRILIERELEGALYRLLVFDGVVIDAVRHSSPTVVGDGRSRIVELIHTENEKRIAARGERSLWLLRVDLDCLFTLERAGLTLTSIVPAGERIAVKTATRENARGDNQTVTDALPPQLVATALRAVDKVGLRLGGVDVIAPHPLGTESAAEAVVIEVNGTPGLSHHWLVADRAGATRVAEPILERLLNESDAR